MDVEMIIKEYDKRLKEQSVKEVEAFLEENIKKAKEIKDDNALFSLYNEVIGFFRDITCESKAIYYCKSLLELMDKMKLKDTTYYATALLNITNAYRAFGMLKESKELYDEIYKIYEKHYEKTDVIFAGYYNNLGLLYQEMNDYESAIKVFEQALIIAKADDKYRMEAAISKINLAATLFCAGSEEKLREGKKYLEEAVLYFEENAKDDFHYSAALAAYGDLYTELKNYKKALKYYQSAMDNLYSHVGKTKNYQRIEEKYLSVKNMSKDSTKAEETGRKLVERFKQQKVKMAFGVAGEGSECFGYDDYISTDHDYGEGFIVWLTEKDYSRFGDEVSREYKKLMGENNETGGFFQKRRGVMSINEFYNSILKTELNYEDGDKIPFDSIDEENLATAINGEVFFDESGVFSRIRNEIKSYYPEEFRRKKLANRLHEFSQYAQSNYERMMARKDYVSAAICKAKAIETVMDIGYLLNKKYAPFYKWKKRGMEDFTVLRELIEDVEKITEITIQKKAWENYIYDSGKINKNDETVMMFEKVAKDILEEMKKQNLVDGMDTFLDGYCYQVLNGKNMDYIDEIVKREWRQFDRVTNEGGRAECQDDFETFSIMRQSQYMAYDRDILSGYLLDIINAAKNDRNLITEKYAIMMKSTDYDEYAKISKMLPEISMDREKIQEEIIKIQVTWMEEFAQKYRKLARSARTIRTSTDTKYNTSYETYLRGEISTYSENTFLLYGRFIVRLLNENRNLAFEIMENTVKMYGYATLDEAEEKLD